MLYSRKHPEGEDVEFGCCHTHDTAEIEQMRAESAGRCASAEWDGFKKLYFDEKLDQLQRQCDNKLQVTRMILTDKENMIKSGKFIFVILRKKKPPLMLRYGKWVETTMEWLKAAEARGLTLVEQRGGKFNKNRKPREADASGEPIGEKHITPVTRERAQYLSAQGEMIYWEEERAFHVTYGDAETDIRGAAAIEGDSGDAVPLASSATTGK